MVLVSSMISSGSCSGSKIDYGAQSSWKGACQTGRKQSPIDIKCGQAKGKNESDQTDLTKCLNPSISSHIGQKML